MRVTKKLSLAETHPELAAQADGWDPKTVTAKSHKRVDWKCGLGHRWNVDISNRSYPIGISGQISLMLCSLT